MTKVTVGDLIVLSRLVKAAIVRHGVDSPQTKKAVLAEREARRIARLEMACLTYGPQPN